jgi:hypothetical protein
LAEDAFFPLFLRAISGIESLETGGDAVEVFRVASGEPGIRAVKVINTAMMEGAKYLTLISQRPRNIDPDIMANIRNYAILRITNMKDQSMIESSSHRLVSDLPSLNQEEDALVGPFKSLVAIINVTSRLTAHHGAIPTLRGCEERLAEEVARLRGEGW